MFFFWVRMKCNRCSHVIMIDFSTHRRLPLVAFLGRWVPNFCLGNTARNRTTVRARTSIETASVLHTLPVRYLLYLSEFFFFQRSDKSSNWLEFSWSLHYGAGHALPFEVTSWTKNKVLHSLPYESPAQRLMTNVTDKCLVSRKEPRGQRAHAVAVLFMILTLKHYSLSSQLQRRNTDEKHNEIRSEIKEWIWSHRRQTKENPRNLRRESRFTPRSSRRITTVCSFSRFSSSKCCPEYSIF